MKKIICTFIVFILLVSASIPVFAMEIKDVKAIQSNRAILRNGTTTKTYYFDIDGTNISIPLEVRMVWSLTYFIDTGKVNSCSMPMVSVSVSSDYPYESDLFISLKSVTTKGNKSGEYACRFTAIYEPAISNSTGDIEYLKQVDSFIVTVVADGDASAQ